MNEKSFYRSLLLFKSLNWLSRLFIAALILTGVHFIFILVYFCLHFFLELLTALGNESYKRMEEEKAFKLLRAKNAIEAVQLIGVH